MNSAITLSHCIAVILAVGLAASAADATVVSTFDSGLDGWAKANSDSGSDVIWESTGGNPGGYLRYDEAGSGILDFVAAPAKFLGDKASYYGGTLSFDIRTDTLSNPTNVDAQVMLIGNGRTLRFALPDPSPVNIWHHRSIDLTETAGWIDDGTDAAPSQSDMIAVLGDLTSLQLLTDYRNGDENPSYDNVMLVPEPASLALLGGGLLLIARRPRTR